VEKTKKKVIVEKSDFVVLHVLVPVAIVIGTTTEKKNNEETMDYGYR